MTYDPAKRRAAHVRTTYGLELEDVERILAAQGGCCHICGRPLSTSGTIQIDHDHKTGLIRGLLCWTCNHKVIGRRRDPEIFHRAADYLEDPPAVRVLGEKHVPKKKRASTRRART